MRNYICILCMGFSCFSFGQHSVHEGAVPQQAHVSVCSRVQNIPLESKGLAQPHHPFLKFGGRKEELTSDALPRTDPKIVGEVYQMLKVADLLLTQHRIPYWIDGGTALGAARHQGMIPWDDDADLVFPAEYESQIRALDDEFARYGLHLTGQLDGVLHLYPSRQKRYPFVDIVGYSLQSDHKLRYEQMLFRLCFAKFYWLPDEVSPLIRVKYGPLELNAPNDMTRYLIDGYGEDCMTTAVFKKHHCVDSQKGSMKKVKIVNFAPAEYQIENCAIPLD